MAKPNQHQARAMYCLADCLLTVEDGYLEKDECPDLQDFTNLSVTDLAMSFACAIDCFDFKEELRLKRKAGRLMRMWDVLSNWSAVHDRTE